MGPDVHVYLILALCCDIWVSHMHGAEAFKYSNIISQMFCQFNATLL